MVLPSADPGLKARVAKILAEEIQPALETASGHIEVLDVNQAVVRVRLHGPCSGCPSMVLAAILGIEQELRKRVPEVEYLEAVP